MESEHILKYYRETTEVETISNLLRDKDKQKIQLKGLVGSMDACLSIAVADSVNRTHLFVLSEKEEAAYFFNNLQNLAKKSNVFFFPSAFKRPYFPDSYSNALVLERIETLSKISENGNSTNLIVTFPHALGERIVNQESLKAKTIKLRSNEEVELEFLAELLIDNHFQRSDYVYEAGQFSVRGGIVDIYSFSNELPFRFEFFGNQIESIRTFDPETQSSVEIVSEAVIIPKIQFDESNAQYDSFLNLLPEGTTVWIKDVEFSKQVITKSCAELNDHDIDESWANYDEVNQIFKNSDRYFLSADALLGGLEQHSIVELGPHFYFDATNSIEFRSSPQPDFHKDFKLLVSNLIQNTEQGIKNIICADSEKQRNRLIEIFNDIEEEVEYEAIELSIHKGFVDKSLRIACYTDHQIFDRFHKFKLRKAYSKQRIISLKELQELKPGDYVTHIDHGIGKFAGLERIEVDGKLQEAVKIVYKDQDLLYVNIHSLHRISKYTGKDAMAPKLNKLGSVSWENLKKKTKSKVKDIANELIKLYAKRKAQKGFAFSPDTYLQSELEASFIYEDTPDQLKSTEDVKTDMEKENPMDRLICGDVGFGKTEVAIRAAFKAVSDSKQVAILVPTTILALQHYQTFTERLKDFPCTVDYLNRFKSNAEQKKTIKELEEGKIDILIGTHRLVSKDVKFKDIGLLIIDEEQKFGVSIKEKLRQFRENVDTLTLTATPIPRTLHFSMMGARDLSIINTAPPNRQPIDTELHIFNEEVIREAINYEISRGGQVFFIHNRVKDIEDVAVLLRKICPGVHIGIGHAQMDNKRLEKVMLDFIGGEYGVLLCTTIVESGLDIPNANTMIINNAQNFGLSDLYQLRGRVGRSNRKAFCYLISPPLSTITQEARKRLSAIEEFTDLGSGFNVALRDMDIRGAGNLLGAEQSGYISEMGFNMYHKILDEAIKELKEDEFKDLFKNQKPKEFVNDCQIDTDLSILIPDSYVENISERLNLYNEINAQKDEEGLKKIKSRMVDRFGKSPIEVEELFDTVRLRWLATKLGFERIVMKNQVMNCYFVKKNEDYYNSDIFSSILQYVQTHPSGCEMKETAKSLILRINLIDTIAVAIQKLTKMAGMEKKKEELQS